MQSFFSVWPEACQFAYCGANVERIVSVFSSLDVLDSLRNDWCSVFSVSLTPLTHTLTHTATGPYGNSGAGRTKREPEP